MCRASSPVSANGKGRKPSGCLGSGHASGALRPVCALLLSVLSFFPLIIHSLIPSWFFFLMWRNYLNFEGASTQQDSMMPLVGQQLLSACTLWRNNYCCSSYVMKYRQMYIHMLWCLIAWGKKKYNNVVIEICFRVYSLHWRSQLKDHFEPHKSKGKASGRFKCALCKQ